jgi:hypothetical protein
MKNFITFLFKIRLILFLLLLVSISTFSQSDDSLYYLNPDYHVAKELLNGKIVMLGDEEHHSIDPYHSLNSVLNEWLNIVKEYDNDSQHLTLILEYCSEDARIISEYMKVGNIEPLLNLILPSDCFEDIEQYANLRSFYLKIENINQSRLNKINFDITGFEDSIYGCNNFSDYVLKTTKRDKELWFVNQRDSMTASGIIVYTLKNPSNKILIFYGSGHLQKGFVRKETRLLSDSESFGFYLSTYLKNEYGDSNVNTVRQKFLSSSEFYDDNGFKIFNGEDIVIPMKNLKIAAFQDENVDFMIMRHKSSGYFQPHRVNFTFTRRLLEKYVDQGLRMKSSFPLEEAKLFYNANLFYFNFISGNNFNNIEEAQDWINKDIFDGIERIESTEFAVKMFNFFYISKNRNFLNQLGFEDKIIDTTFKPDTNYWKETYWPEQKKRVKFMNCIGIFWFGYADEQVKAKEYLKEFSGEDYQEPEKYFQWYRMKYYGYEY